MWPKPTEAGWSIVDSDWFNFEFIHHFLDLFLKIKQNNEIARNNEIAGNNEIHKYPDFLQNLRELAFLHKCAKKTKFCAIFTRNISKSFRNFCTIFVHKISTGNPLFGNNALKTQTYFFQLCLCQFWYFLFCNINNIGVKGLFYFYFFNSYFY